MSTELTVSEDMKIFNSRLLSLIKSHLNNLDTDITRIIVGENLNINYKGVGLKFDNGKFIIEIDVE